MGDMGCCLPACLPARYQEEVATCYYSLSLPEWGILVLYTLGERVCAIERRGRRKGDAGGGGSTHFIKHRYTQHG